MENKRNSFTAGIAILLVLLVYAMFIWIGPWRGRGYTSNYYFQMASAFRHGQIALETKPDPALLALPNPYDHKARKNIPLLGDASLYNGKYYLYFGPLPSLILAPILFLVPIQPGDQIFVYIFLVGLFLIQTNFLIAIVRRYFSRLPEWIVAGGILLLGLTGPFTRMLSHPFIHEAAISGGQFFSTAGLYVTFLALQAKPVNSRKLFWAGVLWSCAVATRATQVFPVSVMVLVTLIFLVIENRKAYAAKKIMVPATALIAPLFLSGMLLAWYNWVRFDSIFEFGLYYQLAAFNLQANYSLLFSRVYIIQNIYNYFFNGFHLMGTFPFVYPLPGPEKPISVSPDLPNLYAVEGKFPGLFSSTPFLVFFIVPVVLLLVRFFHAFQKKGWAPEMHNEVDWIVMYLAGCFVASSVPVLLYFYVGARFETEFITSLNLLAIIGYGQLYALIKGATLRKWTAIAGAVLLGFSLLLNMTLAYLGVTTI